MRVAIAPVWVLAIVGVSASDAQAALTATPIVATDAGDGNVYGGGTGDFVSPSQSSSTTDFAFNLTTGALRVSFDQRRTGATASFARASSVITLLPDEQLDYTLSGVFELLGANRVFHKCVIARPLDRTGSVRQHPGQPGHHQRDLRAG